MDTLLNVAVFLRKVTMWIPRHEDRLVAFQGNGTVQRLCVATQRAMEEKQSQTSIDISEKVVRNQRCEIRE